MKNNELEISEEELYCVVLDHLRDLNRELVELHQDVQASFDRMDKMDYQQSKLYEKRR